MQNLRRLIDFYIQSSLHVGLAVVSLVFVTVYAGNLSKHILYGFCVFFGTVLSYNFLKYFVVFKSNNFNFYRYYKILGVSFLAGIGFLFSFFWLQRSVQIHILISGLFVLLYPLLRKFGWLKLFLVSFVVTYVTVYIPFILNKPVLLDYYVSLSQRFLILSSLLIPFEIMDSKTDAKTLNTLPQFFGIQKAKQFGYGFIVVFIFLDFLNFSIHNFLINAIIAIVTVHFIRFTSLDKDEYYTSFWVESVPIFWLGLLLLFQ